MRRMIQNPSLVLSAISMGGAATSNQPCFQNAGALVKYQSPSLTLENRLIPEELAPGHVRVRPFAVGICGSDIHLLQTHECTGQIKFSAPLSIPNEGRVIGHEGIAQIVAVGQQVEGYSVGDWVVPSSVYHCGQCRACLEQKPNQCIKATLLGAQTEGIFAKFADLNSRLLVNVSRFVKSDESKISLAALEPASTSLQACEMAGLGPRRSVIIFGAGPIGAYAAMIAKITLGCEVVIVVEPLEKRRHKVSRWADAVFPSVSEFLDSDFRKLVFDAVIEASGYLENINLVFRKIGAGGKVVLLARSGEPLDLRHVDHLITNAISIQGCRGQLGGYMERVAELYDSGLLPLGELIDHAGYGLETLRDLLQDPSKVTEQFCKAVVNI